MNKAPTTTSITNAATLSSTPSNQGTPFTVQWSVSSAFPGTPTGFVNVTISGGFESCFAPVGDGQCNITPLTSGNKSITVSYFGDAIYDPSDSAPVSHQVDPAPPVNYVVTKTADTDDGVCDPDCSLREAVNAANGLSNADTITFDLPIATDPGCNAGVGPFG